MINAFNHIIKIGFYFLFLIVPLVFYHRTSELFEFNKMITVYILTVVIVFAWLAKCVINKKLIFRRTLLDIPILIFIFSQLLSTLISVDPRTSLLGYYSRFHGGLLSTISYAFLYWAFVSNMTKKSTLKSIYSLLTAAIIIAVWGTFEHFGRSVSCLIIPPDRSFDVTCWVQDVQNRVYATLGQPNWMAAWIISLIPVSWALAFYHTKDKIVENSFFKLFKNPYFWIFASALLFASLIFTKSRSGYLGLAIAFLVFWPLLLIKLKKTGDILIKKNIWKYFVLVLFSFLFLIAVFATPWTPSVSTLFNKSTNIEKEEEKYLGTVLDVGGSDSGEIRKIVWKGALNIWGAYPILGSGVETFAFSYYNFRPSKHNLVSEWDFLYNKAHNEYLNFAATTGTIGLIAYTVLIIASIFQFYNITYYKRGLKRSETVSNKSPNSTYFGRFNIGSISNLNIALLSGYVSILVTNFFGFSVVAVAVLFFLYPAFAITLSTPGVKLKLVNKNYIPSNFQSVLIFILVITMLYVLFAIGKYWYADYLYATGKIHSDVGNYAHARQLLQSAIDKSPKEAIFWDEYAKNEGSIALFFAEEDFDSASQFAESANNLSAKAVQLSPANVNLKRTRASLLTRLTAIDNKYLILAKDALQEAVSLAPTEAKLVYNLGLTYIRIGDMQSGVEYINQAIEMKPNYKDARYALALILIDADEIELARDQLNYIINNISPNDRAVIEELQNLK